MENESKMTSKLIESLSCIETVKLCNGIDGVSKRVYDKYEQYLESFIRIGKIENLLYGIKTFVDSTGQIIILTLGGAGVIFGVFSIGDLITFNVVLSYFIEPIKRILGLQSEYQNALIAARRLKEIVDLETEKEMNGEKKIELDYDIRFENVDFSVLWCCITKWSGIPNGRWKDCISRTYKGICSQQNSAHTFGVRN